MSSADRPTFSLGELVAECHRECQMRKRVYGNKIREGTMTREEANRRWAMMREIGRIVEAEMMRKNPVATGGGGEQSSLFGPPTGDPDHPHADA